MSVQLSKRLRAVADFVPRGARLADIGTDHALLPAALLTEKRIAHAIAMDVGEGPLASALRTLREAGLDENGAIELRRSDGFLALQKGEADCAVIAGMGGELMLRILKAADVRTLQIHTLVLEPQSEVANVRRFLASSALAITDEVMVEEDDRFYPVLRVDTKADLDPYLLACRALLEEGVTEKQVKRMLFRYGPVLMKKKDAVLREYLKKECARMKAALRQIFEHDVKQDEHILALRQEYEDAVLAYALTGGTDAV